MSDSLDLTVKGIKNPRKEDFTFKWDGEEYTIKAGQIKLYPTWLAEHASIKLARIIITEKYNFAEINNIKLLEETTASLLVDSENKLDTEKLPEAEKVLKQVTELNKQPEVTASTSDTEVVDNGFANLNVVSESEEDMLKEEMKANNPKGFKESEYAEMGFNELKKVAKSFEVNVFQKSREIITKEVLDKQYGTN